VLVLDGFSQTLEHVGLGVGLHQEVDSGRTDFGGLGLVLVEPVEDSAGKRGLDLADIAEGDNHLEALEVRNLLFAFEVGLKDREDLRVSNIAEGADVGLDADAVSFTNGLTELLSEVGDVVTGDSL